MFNGENLNVVVSGGNFNINQHHQTALRSDPLEAILRIFGDKYVQNATHDNNDDLDVPKCHPGTRTSFLSRLETGVQDTETSVRVTWLHGPAGAGKSAIARSLAGKLHREGLLAGSFFFFRTDSKRNTEKSLVTTLAYQIACSIPKTQVYIANAISADPSICSRSLPTQFETLILKPLECITAPECNSLLHPMLVIIDGLDECVGQKARNVVLSMVFEAVPLLHGCIKFLIVSRPEYDIQRSFDSAAGNLRKHINTVELQGDLRAYEDVRNYLCDNFHRIKHTHPLRDHFPSDWPSEDAIERLVDKSSGHFIYASTVIKYIENDFDQPQERLDIVVNLRTTSQNPYAALDALYLNILASSRPNHALLVNILSIVILDHPFDKDILSLDQATMKSVPFIENVLFLQSGGLQLALLDLKSLVGVEDTVKFWHKSFSDFLLNPSRSHEFYSPSAHACTVIAKGCLKLLSDKTGLLERSWRNFTNKDPMLQCHVLLNLCCEDAIVDPDFQTAMMEYEFNVIPPHPDRPGLYFRVLCSCLRNYQRGFNFHGTDVVEHLHRQFDNYLLSELRRFVPLDSEIMKALQATVSPHRIDWIAYRQLADKNPSQFFNYESCFLCYMYYEEIMLPIGGVILGEFFYSKDRSGEYFLGESPPKPLSPKWMSSLSFLTQRPKRNMRKNSQGTKDYARA